MSKPLELTVYPPLERPSCGAEILPYQDQWRREKDLTQAKRLTDAELAAEYHQIEKEAWCLVAKESISKERDRELSERVDEMSATALRFATLPHYDEDQP